jgi:hypothetical protein
LCHNNSTTIIITHGQVALFGVSPPLPPSPWLCAGGKKNHYHKKQQARVLVEFEISRIGTRILARRPA